MHKGGLTLLIERTRRVRKQQTFNCRDTLNEANTERYILSRACLCEPGGCHALANRLVFRKRIVYLIYCHLLHSLVLAKLVRYVVFYLFRILADCVDIIPSAPKLSVSILKFQITVFLVYQYTAFAFQKSHKSRNTHFGWYLYAHMHVIEANLCFKYFYSFPFKQLT